MRAFEQGPLRSHRPVWLVGLLCTVLVAGCAGDTARAAAPSATASPAASSSSVPSPSLPADPFVGKVVVTVTDDLVVRSAPRVANDSVIHRPYLPRGTELKVIGGPVKASGYTWYQVVPVTFVLEGKPPSGWVAAAGKDGAPWIALPGTVVTAISAGYHHSCALTETGGVRCWGRNDAGQLGDGTKLDRMVPVDVVGLERGVAAISAGGRHTCAVTTAGGVKCWGWNDSGQLGDGTKVDRLAPVDVVGLSDGIRAVSAGDVHTCAVADDGSPLCWGYDGYGELGIGGSSGERPTPVAITGIPGGVEEISAGSGHTCALTYAGGVKCWGINYTLGDGTTRRSSVPVDVTGLARGVRAIGTGASPTCALKDDGSAWCWGGVLGTGTTKRSLVPVQVSALGRHVDAIASGGGRRCAVLDAGGVKCWGDNRYGSLGDGTLSARKAPVAVRGLPGRATGVAAGGWHTCALLEDGRVFCWGHGNHGELGYRRTSNSPIPVQVVFAGSPAH